MQPNFSYVDPFTQDIKCVRILSDSQAEILALHRESIKSKSVQRALEILVTLSYLTKTMSINMGKGTHAHRR